jgi:hypothetical protein
MDAVDATDAAAPPLWRIHQTQNRGRVVLATAPLPPGTLACAVAPYAVVVTDAELATTCHHCFAPLRPTASLLPCQCVGCGVAVYCGAGCARAAGPDHAQACKGLRKLSLLQLLGDKSDNLRLLLAALARRQREQLAEVRFGYVMEQ